MTWRRLVGGVMWVVGCTADGSTPEPVDPSVHDVPPVSVGVEEADDRSESTRKRGPAFKTWMALMRSGCDTAQVPVWTPIEARWLRNVALAAKGRTFENEDLAMFYAQDGGWYVPGGGSLNLSGEEAACVVRLKQLTTSLRETLPIPEELESRMIRDHALFGVLRQWGNVPTTPYGEARFDDDEQGMLWMHIDKHGCDAPPGEDDACVGYRIGCPIEGACVTVMER